MQDSKQYINNHFSIENYATLHTYSQPLEVLHRFALVSPHVNNVQVFLTRSDRRWALIQSLVKHLWFLLFDVQFHFDAFAFILQLLSQTRQLVKYICTSSAAVSRLAAM